MTIEWTKERPTDNRSRMVRMHLRDERYTEPWFADGSGGWSDAWADYEFEVLPPLDASDVIFPKIGAGELIAVVLGSDGVATIKDSNPKDAVGCKKAPLSVVPIPPLYEVAAGMLEGACKYGRHNYRVIGVRGSVYFDAAFRHLTSWWEGQDIDPASGIHHISKAVAGLMVMRDAMMAGKFHDDRPPAAVEGWEAAVQTQVDAILQRYPEPKAPYTRDSEGA